MWVENSTISAKLSEATVMKFGWTGMALLSSLILTCTGEARTGHQLHEFQKVHLTPIYWSEGADYGDFNQDGHLDVVCGPHIYLGPEYKHRHEFYPAVAPTKRGHHDRQVYALDNFFAWTHDFNSDGWSDVLTVGLPNQPAYWYENPGASFAGRPKGPPVHWKKHDVIDQVKLESPRFGDLTGDGEPELIFGYGNRMGYATPDESDPTKLWRFHPVSAEMKLHHYMHGLGFGDIDGDGRSDLIIKDGWWQQPDSLGGDPEWEYNSFKFAERGGSQMFVYDVNGDGLNDIVSSINGHGWGLSWFEQTRADGEISFTEHVLMSKEAENTDNPYGVQFSQLHAMALVDVDNDGLKDIITGKTYRAHDFYDPGSREPAVIYWFQLTRSNGKVQYVPHQIDDSSGIGRQLVTGDLNQDGLLDFVVGNKNGAFVFLQQSRSVSEAEWNEAQPQKSR